MGAIARGRKLGGAHASMAGMKALTSFVSRHAAVLALLVSAVTAIGFGARVEGYSHAQYPLAVLGAPQLPDSSWFNVLAFVVPGLLVASIAARLRSRLGSANGRQTLHWAARIGAQLMLLAALAFATQGVFTLDASDLAGAQNGRHAAAWLVWLIASIVGGAMLWIGLRRQAQTNALAAASLAFAVFLPVVALILPALLPAGFTQRLAFLLWFAWAIAAGALIPQSSYSKPRQP